MRISDWSSDVCSSDLRFLIRVGLPLRGISAIFSLAIRRSSWLRLSSLAVALSFAYFGAYFLASLRRRSFLLIALFLAIGVFLCFSGFGFMLATRRGRNAAAMGMIRACRDRKSTRLNSSH